MVIKEGRKIDEGRKGRDEGRTEGRKERDEGRKNKRKEGRKEGRTAVYLLRGWFWRGHRCRRRCLEFTTDRILRNFL
jgi:hypothetical protein